MFIASSERRDSEVCQPEMLSILFRAMMKGVLFAFRICRTSAVCGLIPSFMSITRIAMSARDPPCFRMFVNAAWPGVSMKSRPGICRGIWNLSRVVLARCSMFSFGRVVKEIFWVMPPASPVWIEVPLILSRILVLPWSTWPATVTIGCRIVMFREDGVGLKSFGLDVSG